MEQRKRGRKRLGKMKRWHNVMLRFNDMEYDKIENNMRIVSSGYFGKGRNKSFT